MLIFDIETNGLLPNVSKLHCLAIYDTKADALDAYTPDTVEQGVRRLQEALAAGTTICGHNIIGYDLPALEKLLPWFSVSRAERAFVLDTLILARLIYADLEITDLGLIKSGKLPRSLYNSHTLKAWGCRLGEHKGDWGEQKDAWKDFHPDMLAYNKQDVIVTTRLLEKLLAAHCSERAIRLEHEVAWLMQKQEQNGFPFNKAAALQLEETLRARQASLRAALTRKIPTLPDKIFIPKRDNKTLGYKKGVPIQRYKDFNPNSRQQIEYVIRTLYGYEPQEADLYETGGDDTKPLKDCRLKIDDETFHFIRHDAAAPEKVKTIAALLEESLLIGKRLGQLSDGKNAWLDMMGKDGNIHGHVITNGTVSGRAAHTSPNIAQVPAVSSPYGKECRALFTAGGWWQAGVDACGLELRCLAHYMFPYDDGQYAHTILNGDIHTMNQQAAGLPERNQAKTFIYAFLYGAGDAKIGHIIKGDAKDGKAIKRKFLKATPAIKKLRDAVQNALVETDKGRVVRWKRHYLKGLDGRLLRVRSPHSALNLLLQSAGALLCKKWIVLTEERLLARGLKHGWDGDFVYLAWIHDEIQLACRTWATAEIVLEEAQAAMRDTQACFGFRVQLDTEGKIGKNWADTH